MNSKKTLSFIIMLLTVIVGNAQQQVEKLSLEAFEQKLNQAKRPQILDVRTPQEFSENHLIGAINLSTTDTAAYAKKIEALRKQEPVFVYSINNGRSGVVAKQLREKGFSEVYALPGGIAHWIGAGKPLESKAAKGISTEEFQRAVASKNLVLVDVGSKYCGGCKKLAPIVDAVGREQADALDVFKIELYDNRALVSSLEIESVPTLILYKGSKPVWKKSGSITKEEIQEAIASAASGSSN